jgi:Ni/Fe-hydrogenase subunit HybB-like protein
MNRRLMALKTVLWALVGVLAPITVVRFAYGLGTVTHLSDAAPWGLWVAFDVMAGVALAAGGFVLAATVHIFGLERYRQFVRPAVLTAMLGYMLVAVGLLYDLGLPWHIWHPIIYPQLHSVLFEVAACVMLYLTVLVLEFAPVVLEHPWLDRPALRWMYRALRRLTIPLVIAGIALSTLHQSSLGSLFLITPARLHPLWYSPNIWILFFVSAVGLGLMMVVLESVLAGAFLGHRLPRAQLARLGAAGAVVLGLYAAFRLVDLAVRGRLGMVVDGSWQSWVFIVELAVSAVVPAVLLTSRRVRSSIGGLATAAALTVFGMVMYRMDACIVAFARPAGATYFPSWMEIGVSLGLVAAGVLAFLFFVQHFAVYEAEAAPAEAPAPSAPMRAPAEPIAVRGLLPRALTAGRRYSLAAVGAAAATVLFLPLRGPEPLPTPVLRPRTLPGFVVGRADSAAHGLVLADADHAAARDSGPVPLLVIDGNRDGMVVLFDHEAHKRRTGGNGGCAMCHHLDVPLDKASSCSECHRDMYDSTATFNHESHVREEGGERGCVKCHAAGVTKTYATATACVDCHHTPVVARPVVAAPYTRWRSAPGYEAAMHGLCIPCHRREVAEHPTQYPAEMTRCAWCHDVDRAGELRRLRPQPAASGQIASREP